MDEVDETLLLLILILGYKYLIRRRGATRPRRKRRWWVRNIFENRSAQGDYHHLVQEMRLTDTEMFFNYTRMDIPTYDKLLRLVGRSIKKKSNRTPLNPDQRLMITLRYLATGDNLLSVALAFRIAKCTASKVIHETTEPIWKALQPGYLPQPSVNGLKRTAEEFYRQWNFPHCMGAIDGKHVRLKAPMNSGSDYHNYKDYFSIVLLAVCDANYFFTLVDIGSKGSESDGGIFARTPFGVNLENGTFPIPPSETLPETNLNMPYFFVGDEAFGLKTYMLRPYPGKFLSWPKKIFNYRLSRARRVIENAFGILVARWRVFQGPIMGEPPLAEKIVKATVCLHNFIKKEQDPQSDNQYCPRNYVDSENESLCPPGTGTGNWRRDVGENGAIENSGRLGSNNARRNDLATRDQLANYFMSPVGSQNVPWQFEYVQRGRQNIIPVDQLGVI